MGLHLDLEQIFVDNAKKRGLRKGGLLINEGDKMTTEKIKDLQEANRLAYSLSSEVVESLKLPQPTSVTIYSIDNIINAKGKLSTIE